MIQVKEFLGDSYHIDSGMNAWIRDHQDIEIVDIKFSISAYPGDEKNDAAGVYSGALLIYKTK